MGGLGGLYISLGICPKVNVIARLEFELAYYYSAVQRFNHYITRHPWAALNISNTQQTT